MRPYMRLRQICLVARDLERAVDDLTSVFGLAVSFRDPMVGKYGLANAVMPVGTTFLEVVSPVAAGTAAGRFLDRRGGDAGYIVINDCEDNTVVRSRAEALGVRVVEAHSYPGEADLLQLHPRDTGGCILEFDHHTGGDDLQGAYKWAGPAWQDYLRTEKAIGIVGAELRAQEPARLAARWSAVYARPVGVGADGEPVIALDNAQLQFLPHPEGREDALSGVVLEVRDAAAILSTAAARGLAVDRETPSVHICGTAFRLVS